MSDHLYYSCWLRGYSPLNMLRHFGRLLERFPISPQNPANSVLRIEAVSAQEPPVIEQAFPDPLDPAEVVAHANEFLHDDSAYTLETFWGLWTFDRDWQLKPTRVSLSCFGPRFADTPIADENDLPEHLRIDFGLESWFLPNPELPDSAWYARSNLKGLLRFVQELDETLAIERRLLWSESGENFAERLKGAAAELDHTQ